jgi:choline dehydrogenase-like flavoprotein
VFRDCDVLVAGGGPSGTGAAIAAARAGADVVLVERHNHLGGLSTGGLVIWIDRITGWSGEPVIAASARNCSTACRKTPWPGRARSHTKCRNGRWAGFRQQPAACCPGRHQLRLGAGEHLAQGPC